MSLTRDDVKRLADLARLDLSDEEIGAMQKDLGTILGFVDRLKDVKTQGIEPMSMPAKSDGWRGDVAFPCDEATRELILANFPERKGDLLKTPGVFEKPKGKGVGSRA